MDRETSKGGDKMNFKSLFRLGLLFLLASAPAQALAQDEERNFYLNFNLGLGSGSSIKATDVPGGQDFDFDSGFVVGLGLGYRINPNVRVEGFFSRRGNEVDRPDCNACFIPANLDDGEVTANSFLIHIYGDLRADESQSLYPFAGFGLGAAGVSADLERGGVPVVDDSATVLAYQITFGVRFDLPKWALTLAFQYFGTQDPGFKNLSGQDVDIKFQRLEFVLGAAYRF